MIYFNRKLTISCQRKVEIAVLNGLYGGHGIDEDHNHHYRREEVPAEAPVERDLFVAHELDVIAEVLQAYKKISVYFHLKETGNK